MRILSISLYLMILISISDSQWIHQQSNTITALYKIFMLDENTGWACGQNGIIVKTTNSGNNWINYKTPESYCVTTIYFINQQTGWCSIFDDRIEITPAYEIIYKSTNGGINWYQLYKDSANCIKDSYFINESTGFMTNWDLSDGSYSVLKTINGGISWNKQNIPVYYSDGINNIYFVNQFTGFIAGSRQIFKTTNTGENWIPTNTPSSQYVFYLDFINSNTGWAFGRRAIKTTNAGANWIIMSVDIINYFNTSIDFINENTGFISAEYGKIHFTTNSGVTWSTVNSNTTFYLHDICFVNQQTGWVVGEFGTILKTTTGGISP